MKAPRSLSGERFARLLSRYGYEFRRQAGSHMRYTSTIMGYEHHVAIPHHRDLKVGLLMDVLGEVAEYLGRDRDELLEELFG